MWMQKQNDKQKVMKMMMLSCAFDVCVRVNSSLVLAFLA